MIKRIFSLIAFSLVASMACFSAEVTAEDAQKAYENDNFSEALNIYGQLAAQQGTSDQLYFNMGNCHYRLGNLGQALAYYERALKLNPANKDARTNIDFVRGKAGLSETTESGSFIVNSFSRFITSHHSDTWALWAGIAFALAIIAIILYIVSNVIIIRKIGFFGAIVMLIAFGIFIAFAFHAHNAIANTRHAIVITPSVTLSTSPRTPKDKTEEAFLLNEGYKVEVIDSVQNNSEKWYEVTTDDEHRAWIASQHIEII